LRVTVPSFAKLNLDLRVLNRRPDGYHDLRTIFQTISLKDTLTIEFEAGPRTRIEIDSSVVIPDNLVARAARLALDALRVRALVRFELKKRIPMGAGLGGGSSNAAAVLAALPALARKKMAPADLFGLAESLGSDVPFFLRGGTAVGLDRGTELYPLPDLEAHAALVVSTGIHVSTREAYAALGRTTLATDRLTSPAASPILREFQRVAWALGSCRLNEIPLTNDFEQVVFEMHPELPALRRKLRRLGAGLVRMTGSGSALYGIFESLEQSRAAALRFEAGTAHAVRFLGRRRYGNAWRRALGEFALRQPPISGE